MTRISWNELDWVRRGVWNKARVTLFAGDELVIEEGWSVYGPTYVKISHNPATGHIRLRYRDMDINLDNPYTYPCKWCGAIRYQPCVGDNPLCVFRVFDERFFDVPKK